MLEVITNMQKIPYLKNRFLTATLSIDGYRSESPVIVRRGDKSYIVARHLDRGNMEEYRKMGLLPYDSEPVYYRPYFAFVPITPPAHGTFDEAFEYVAGDDRNMKIHRDMPIQLYEMFDRKFDISMEDEIPVPLKYLYKLDRKTVIEKFAEGRDIAVEIAGELLKSSRDREELLEMMETAEDDRFELLDRLMEEKKIDWMLFTTCLGVQEVTGFGMDNFSDEEAAALYRRGSDTVYFMSAKVHDGFGTEEILYEPAEYVKELIGNDAVGIEEQHFSYGWYKAFGMDQKKWKKAQALARNFRLYRGDFNLPYYVITSRTGAFSIEKAMEWAKKQVMEGNPVTEKEVGFKQEQLAAEFAKENKIPFALSKYWTGLHASDRSVTPSYAFEHVITKESKALKFDAGMLLKDNSGILRAASDIARTICFEECGDIFYEIADKVMLEMVEGAKPGITGEDIFKATMGRIEDFRDELEAVGMIPTEKVEEAFKRDVGHGLSLHEPGTFWFERGAEMKTKTGMVCAHEIQWSTRGFSIGTEDNFVIGKNKGLNMCRD